MNEVNKTHGESGSTSYLFGEFELNPNRFVLLKNGEEVPLRHQCFMVLEYLVLRSGNLVTKQELMDAVWSDVVVTDASVPQCIFSIRKALDDREKTVIRSVPRSGYIFDLPVTARRFERESNTRFARPFLPALPAGVGRSTALAVALILSVPVVTALMSLAAEIRVDDLSTTASAADTRTSNAQALSNYELATYYYGRRAKGDPNRAVEHFRAAVEIDPGFADAWVGLAGSLWLRSQKEGSDPAAVRGDMRIALEKALELNPNQPEANARLAAFYSHEGDFETARALYDRALTYGTDNSWVLASAAAEALHEFRYEEAAALQGKAATLDPLSFAAQSNLAIFLQLAGKHDEALSVFQALIDLAPGSQAEILEGMAHSYIIQNRYRLAESVARQLPPGLERDQIRALVAFGLDRQEEFDRLTQRISAQSGLDPAIHLAEIYTHTGNRDESYRWLEEAEKRARSGAKPDVPIDGNLFHALHSPYFSRISSEPRWKDWRVSITESYTGDSFFDLVATNASVDLQSLVN